MNSKRIKFVLLLLSLLLLPSQLGYHFWPTWSLVNGIRVDYLSPTIYFTDILVMLLMVFKGPRFKIQGLIILFAVLNIFFSTNPLVSIYRWLRVYEYFWLFKYLTFEFEWKFKIVNWSLPLAILWTSGLAWAQFLLQRSVGGWLYWLGERTFSITTPGVAKVFISQLGLVLRPYATLPHPNALAGWLLVAGLIVGSWPQIISWVTIPLTFSRSAILLLPLWLLRKSKILMILLFIICYLLFAHLGNPTSFVERQVLLLQSLQVIKQHLWLGVGLGNFVYWVPTVRQPVHNIYLLLASELGVPAAAVLIIGFLKYLLKIENWNLKIAVLSILLTGLSDHYWLTLHQNSLLLVVLLATVKITSDDIKNKL